MLGMVCDDNVGLMLKWFMELLSVLVWPSEGNCYFMLLCHVQSISSLEKFPCSCFFRVGCFSSAYLVFRATFFSFQNSVKFLLICYVWVIFINSCTPVKLNSVIFFHQKKLLPGRRDEISSHKAAIKGVNLNKFNTWDVILLYSSSLETSKKSR